MLFSFGQTKEKQGKCNVKFEHKLSYLPVGHADIIHFCVLFFSPSHGSPPPVAFWATLLLELLNASPQVAEQGVQLDQSFQAQSEEEEKSAAL